MPFHIGIFFVVKAIIAASVATWLVSELWKRYRDDVIEWLHANSESTSALRSAVVVFDRIAGVALRVRSRVVVGITGRRETVTERVLSDSEVAELRRTRPDVHQALLDRGYGEQDILQMLT